MGSKTTELILLDSLLQETNLVQWSLKKERRERRWLPPPWQ